MRLAFCVNTNVAILSIRKVRINTTWKFDILINLPGKENDMTDHENFVGEKCSWGILAFAICMKLCDFARTVPI